MQKKIHPLIILLGTIAISMYGFCFALVPIYNKYCRISGINTALTESEYNQSPDFSRTLTIELVTTNNENGTEIFKALQNKITVHPGERKKVSFLVKNIANKTMIVQAIPSFAPFGVAKYFHKLECFCFTQQKLNPNEEKNMSTVFYIDKDIPHDINTVTLAYTLFDVTEKRKTG